jgi:hypothetical protein
MSGNPNLISAINESASVKASKHQPTTIFHEYLQTISSIPSVLNAGERAAFSPSGNSTIDLFVCSILVLRPPPRRGMWTFLQKKPAAAPACEPQKKKSPAPSVRCAPFSGYGSPSTIDYTYYAFLPKRQTW